MTVRNHRPLPLWCFPAASTEPSPPEEESTKLSAVDGQPFSVRAEHTLEWVTPVLYLRGGDAHLFAVDPP